MYIATLSKLLTIINHVSKQYPKTTHGIVAMAMAIGNI